MKEFDMSSWATLGSVQAIASKYKYYLFLILFALFLIAQHWLVFPYHDDWGLAVLDYVIEVQGFTGQNFDFQQLVEFLKGMYLRWSGRVTAFFVQIYLFKYGLEYVRMFQVILILTTVLLTMVIALKKINHSLIVLSISLFMALPAFTLIGGLYWFSAASAYVWGIPIMFSGALLLIITEKPAILASIILGFAATFHEQMAIAVIVFYSTYVIAGYLEYHELNKVKKYVVYSFPIVIGAIFNLFAPGNFARLQSPSSNYINDNFFDIAITNINSISNMIFFQPQGRIFLIYFVISFMALALRYLLARSEGIKKISLYYMLLSAGLILSFYYCPLCFLMLFIMLYGILLFLLQKRNSYGRGVLSLYVGGVSTFMVLMLAPGVPGRSLLTFYFIMFVPIVYSLDVFEAKRFQKIVTLSIMLLFPFSVMNAVYIYKGYLQNYEINTLNNLKLVAAQYDFAHGTYLLEPITLYKLSNPTFAQTMPYERPLIEKWIKKYYSIPTHIQFIWK